MKIRIEGTTGQCEVAAARIAQVLTVLSISDPYPNRGRSVLFRVYLEAEIPRDAGSPEAAARALPEGAAPPPPER